MRLRQARAESRAKANPHACDYQARETKSHPWQVLSQRDFGFFWASLLFSAVGTQISTVAIA
jgi:hypothetical protein